MARYFLPTGLKTEYVATLNLGSWHNFLVKRTAADAHPQMRQLAVPLLRYFQERLPMFFDNIAAPVLPFKEAELVENFMYDEVPARIVHQE
jgi:thymidylate synthase ThyX